MKFILNLSTRAKLLLGFGLIIVCLSVIIVRANRVLSADAMAQKGTLQNYAVVAELIELRADQNFERAKVLEMLLTSDSARQQAAERDVRERDRDIEAGLRTLTGLLRSDAALAARFADLKALRAIYRRDLDATIAAIFAAKTDQAKQGVDRLIDQHVKIREIALEIADAAKSKAEAVAAQAEADGRAAIRTLFGTGIATLVSAAAVALFLNRIIAQPLLEMTGVTARFAEGDLSAVPSIGPRTDEVGQLGQTFSRLAASLRTEIHSIVDGINVLGSSTTEISTSTSQFAASATETATAVGETTTTVDELRQTAQLSSEKAKVVAEAAQRSSQISQGGKKATEEMIEGMNRIRTQMDAIADSMMRLNEQAHTIGQIVAAVEDLAAQSNLLAVNAAIEAANAGEHGKGFAIVAQEVRNLAEQSKQATAQVRTVLADLQKATSGAVLATEQGAKVVEAGVIQSAAAGQSIQALAASAVEAAQAATQIAASSQQQLIGVDQVATAMKGIEQVSAENVTSAKQLESAALALKELGDKLRTLAARYRV